MHISIQSWNETEVNGQLDALATLPCENTGTH
jgi:hypothetical protein